MFIPGQPGADCFGSRSLAGGPVVLQVDRHTELTYTLHVKDLNKTKKTCWRSSVSLLQQLFPLKRSKKANLSRFTPFYWWMTGQHHTNTFEKRINTNKTRPRNLYSKTAIKLLIIHHIFCMKQTWSNLTIWRMTRKIPIRNINDSHYKIYTAKMHEALRSFRSSSRFSQVSGPRTTFCFGDRATPGGATATGRRSKGGARPFGGVWIGGCGLLVGLR